MRAAIGQDGRRLTAAGHEMARRYIFRRPRLPTLWNGFWLFVALDVCFAVVSGGDWRGEYGVVIWGVMIALWMFDVSGNGQIE